MNRMTCAALVVGLAVSGFAAPARAEDASQDEPGSADHERHEWSASKLKDALGLSNEQVAKLDAAMKARAEAVKPLREQSKQQLEKLREQVKSKASDSDIQAALDQLEQTRKGMRDAMEKFKADAAAALTPTQRAKMALRMVDNMKKGWHGRGEGKRGKGKPHSKTPASEESKQ